MTAIGGYALRNLCRVLSLFQNEVRMDHPVVVDKAHVMACIVEPTPMFGVECTHGLNVKDILKMKLEDEKFEASVEGDRYVLSNPDREYSFHLLDETGLPRPKPPVFDTSAVIETDSRTLQRAAEKCSLINDHCVIANGRMSAEGVDTEVSVVLGADDGTGCRTMMPLDYLLKVSKVMTGWARLEFGTDTPLKIGWSTMAYGCTVMIAPRIENREEEE